MGSLASMCKPKTTIYIQEGIVVNVNFRDHEGKNPKTIRIHEGNTLRKAIEMYQEQINKIGYKIMRAIYEPTQVKLNIDTKIKELNINLSDTIILYLK